MHAVTEGVASGVPSGEVLVRFAEAIVAENDEAISLARDAVIAEMGAEAMVDAAAVASNFQRMVRIADSTGIPLGEGLETISREVRAELGLERFRARKEIA